MYDQSVWSKQTNAIPRESYFWTVAPAQRYVVLRKSFQPYNSDIHLPSHI